jgi:N-acyl-D-aspartate/D-glutamate deacylase
MKHAWMALLFVLAGAAMAEAPKVLAVRNARIVTASGPAIERGTVVVRDGLIEAVGASVTIPPDAWVIEGAGLRVYPGFTDAEGGRWRGSAAFAAGGARSRRQAIEYVVGGGAGVGTATG